MYIKNNEKNIESTDYWRAQPAQAGKFFFSFNANSCRVLFPRIEKSVLQDMKAAHSITLSLGPAPLMGGRMAYEILFDDGTFNPYALHTTLEASDRIISQHEDGNALEISIWTEKRKGKSLKTVCVFRRKGRFRVVSEIPCMEPV